jgi:hypothetical protein
MVIPLFHLRSRSSSGFWVLAWCYTLSITPVKIFLTRLENYLRWQMVPLRVTLRHFCAQSSTYWVLNSMVYFYSQSLIMMDSIWKEYWIMNTPEIRTQKSAYMVMSYTFVVPKAWTSKAEKSVTLSSTEAEYYATPKITKEVICSKNLLEEIGVQLQFQITIKCDNVGAIYLANNHCNSQRTKHIDTRRISV